MSNNGKFIDVAARRKLTKSASNKTVVPAEYARSHVIKNPPPLAALKVIHLLMQHAAGEMHLDKKHRILLSEINQLNGVHKYSKKEITDIFIDIQGTSIAYDTDTDWAVGSLLDYARTDIPNPKTNQITVTYEFGTIFKEVAAQSDHWAMMQQTAINKFKRKYSLIIYEYLSSFQELKYKKSETFTFPEMRMLLGIPTGKIKRNPDLVKQVLKPAIREINKYVDSLYLTLHTEKQGRNFTKITIFWETLKHRKSIKKDHMGDPIGTTKI